MRLGVVGAGKLGTTIARVAIEAGYDVAMSGSGAADDIALTIDVLAPGARALTTEEVVKHADMIVLAVPTHRFRELPPDLFAGKILIDAMNYWEPIDGIDDELASADTGTSPIVQSHFPTARVVKSLNQLGYHELEELRRPHGVAGSNRRRRCGRRPRRGAQGDAPDRSARIRPGRRRAARQRSRARARRIAVRGHLHRRRALGPRWRRYQLTGGGLPSALARSAGSHSHTVHA